MAGFVDDEGSTLGFLLSYLFGLDSGGKFRGKGEVLDAISEGSLDIWEQE